MGKILWWHTVVVRIMMDLISGRARMYAEPQSICADLERECDGRHSGTDVRLVIRLLRGSAVMVGSGQVSFAWG